MNSQLQDVFGDIFSRKAWGSRESCSGPGSSLVSTKKVRADLPLLLDWFGIQSVLDLPCGDFHWLSQVDLGGRKYIGADIVPDLIEENRRRHPGVDFRVLDATTDHLPKAELIICRDMLGHLSQPNVDLALRNFVASGASYLLTTTFANRPNGGQPTDGGWRPVNLMLPPYSLLPLALINEGCREGGNHYRDKCLVLFDLRP